MLCLLENVCVSPGIGIATVDYVHKSCELFQNVVVVTSYHKYSWYTRQRSGTCNGVVTLCRQTNSINWERKIMRAFSFPPQIPTLKYRDQHYHCHCPVLPD